jgi:hypothetical protein
LPVAFTRPDVGTPLTPAELDAATDDLIALLKGTRYFDVVDERVHGWPESDPAMGYWFGSWWSGVSVIKASGQVTYRHSPDGADNNGLRTAPLLEGACFAQLMWGKSLTAKLVQRMVRGYSSSQLAMRRSAGDTAKPMLARAHYPANVTSNDGSRSIIIDYAADRPGVDGTSEYVHLPTNPTFGDIWIKNNRSKDDMGHIFRSRVKQILRTHHEAAVNISFLSGQNAAGLALIQGLASRVESDLALITQASPPAGMNPSDVAALFVHSANAGVPLTSAEVRWRRVYGALPQLGNPPSPRLRSTARCVLSGHPRGGALLSSTRRFPNLSAIRRHEPIRQSLGGPVRDERGLHDPPRHPSGTDNQVGHHPANSSGGGRQDRSPLRDRQLRIDGRQARLPQGRGPRFARSPGDSELRR